jgi:hypothetical protein
MMSKNNDAFNDPMVNPLIVDCEGDLTDAFLAPQIHPDYVASMPRFINSDLVSTADGKIGMVIRANAEDRQGIMFYSVLVEDKEMIYSAFQLKKFDGDNS